MNENVSGEQIEAFRKAQSRSEHQPSSASKSFQQELFVSALTSLFVISKVPSQTNDAQNHFLNYVDKLFEKSRLSLKRIYLFSRQSSFFEIVNAAMQNDLEALQTEFMLLHTDAGAIRSRDANELPEFFREEMQRRCAQFQQEVCVDASELFRMQRALRLKKLLSQHVFFLFLNAVLIVGAIVFVVMVLKGDANRIFEGLLGWTEFLKNFFASFSR